VLLLHRTMPTEALITGMQAALRLESCDPDLVAVEARRASYPESVSPLIVPSDEDLGDRPAPSLAGYDELLAGALA
jgi:hypothetical protein